MYIFTCKPEWTDMLTCIYEAWCSRKGQENIRLSLEPVGQYSLLDEFIHVDGDASKAEQVEKAVCSKISPSVYFQISYAAMAYEEDRLDVIYRVLLLGFRFGPEVLQMMQYRDVMRFSEIRHRVGREVSRFQEILRFHEVEKEYYVAHMEPKSRIVIALGAVFADRMPSENFMIIDDVHKEAVIHPREEACFLKQLSNSEYEYFLQTEGRNDSYTDLWKVFFETIAIKERENARCQKNLFPLWARKHAVEFK